MNIVCAPSSFDFQALRGDLDVVLFGRENRTTRGSAGAAIAEVLRHRKLAPTLRAWDFLSIALAVNAADLAGHRDRSSDGWTRDFHLQIAVSDPAFWATQAPTLEALLRFLTTDRWRITFQPGGLYAAAPKAPVQPEHDCVVLLSGGLDSFIGALDLVAQGRSPLAVSQSVRGDAKKQRALATIAGGNLSHLQLNHNTALPDPESPPSQRGRSLAFFAYGILAATTLHRYAVGDRVSLHICENGFITINPPLTGARLGSLSTRTSHPVLLALLQRVLNAAELRVDLDNPYAHHTKGEMLANSTRQRELQRHAHETTSCGRFKRFGYKHCGRCVPCLIRRAAFHAWTVPDRTEYVYDDLSIDDSEHARSDDVRDAAMAIAEVTDVGLDTWLGVTLSSPLLDGIAGQFREVVRRGLVELELFLSRYRIK